MKEEKSITENYNKVEFWGITVVYVMSIFLLVSNAIRFGFENGDAPNRWAFEELNIRFSLLQHYTIPSAVGYTSLYLGYIFLTLYIVPNLRKRTNTVLFSILVLLTCVLVSMILGICDTWILGYKLPVDGDIGVFYEDIFKRRMVFALWLMFLFLIYNVIKYFAIYLLGREEEIRGRYPFITREGIIAAVLWMMTYFLLLLSNAPAEILTIYAIIIPFGIILYWHSLSTLIPMAMKRPKKKFLFYCWKVIQILLVASIPLGTLVFSLFYNGAQVAGIVSGAFMFQLLVTVPVSWFVYKYKLSNRSQLVFLKQALGTQNAHLDLLRAQINPHFLFNSLNTLSGTALQEKAERTGEGIQKLGDMMRFMLTENMQDRIPLNRETEYINNYIALQKLRTAESPNTVITSAIDDEPSALTITPMLLIPFIENAFKHGISLREPSHIRISLQQQGHAIFFDVYNSKHSANENDPERNNNGIGLANVRQRLEMYYPARHELIIRENANEYFVHLTIQLDQ
jgi:hypothetical protein